MNLLLLRSDEVDAEGIAVLDGRRARHLRGVLGVAPGRTLRAGLIDGPLGTACVESIDADTVTLACTFDTPTPALGGDCLILALPRPKVCGRCIETATALGFGKIVLVRSWFTDKSHLLSAGLHPDALERRVVLGLEQARRTMRPKLVIEPLFRPFVEDRLRAVIGEAVGYLADPDAAVDLVAQPPPSGAPFALAIGPERGFNAFEIGLLQAQGFVRVHAGRHPLRVETAVATVFGQLDALRRHRRGPGARG